MGDVGKYYFAGNMAGALAAFDLPLDHYQTKRFARKQT